MGQNRMSNEVFSLVASPAGLRTESAGSGSSGTNEGPKAAPRASTPAAQRPEPPRPASGGKPPASHAGPRKTTPPEQTHAEDFYYVKQIQAKTKLVIVLRDGEEIQGVIDWYDRTCIKVTPNSDAPVVIYKAAIKYMYKQSES